ncbi:glycoside hydrolase family 44 protein [Paenibacillus gansuensis]|uniref:Glycoside hydrolase family 44 protein n=1 Tax=Paenibacillus gansuensis TaxID=306542 RepID=A0ABW5P9D3_9BACL
MKKSLAHWKKAGSIAFAAVLLIQPFSALPKANAAFNTTFTIDTTQERSAISPYIYGTNMSLGGGENFSFVRQGGNRMTGYNWENNASNAGSDYLHSSDDLLCESLTSTECNTAGRSVTKFQDQRIAEGTKSAVTLQMAGYVSKDKNGVVSTTEQAPSSRWVEVANRKGSTLSYPPNTSDNKVYMDEFVDYLVDQYGSASTSNGIMAYLLDNEPGLWAETHPRIHPAKAGAVEVKNKSVDLAKVVKDRDPSALVIGGEMYGYGEYLNLQGAPDWNSVKGSHSWFIDYFLKEMKNASDADGRRLVDVLGLHYYSEAQGGGQRVVWNGGAGTAETQAARVQAPRTLWDSNYSENSWIAQNHSAFLPVIPKVYDSINANNPGTKLAFTEWSFGGESHISGGIAAADTLGIFGRYGVWGANFWASESDSSYVNAAFKLYRNYNGSNGTFGDTKVKSNTNDTANSSVYSSVFQGNDGKLHVIAINKSANDSMNAAFNITSPSNFTSGQVYGFDGSSASITQKASVSGITGNSFTYSIPAMSAYHFVLTASGSGNIDSAQFNFESGQLQGFYAAGGATVAASTAQKYAGSSSLQLSVNGNGYYYARKDSPSGLTAGKTVSFRVWVPSGAGIESVQPYVQDGNWSWYGAWTGYSSLTKNAWNTITLTIPSNAPSPINVIGLELKTSASWNGSIYLDSISW